MAHASVSINSLGPIDNLQIAATGLVPGRNYKLTMTGDTKEDLLVFAAGIGGVAVAQTFGPLKHVTGPQVTEHSSGLEVRAVDSGELVLQTKR